MNILGSLFGGLCLLPQTGGQYLISVGLCMDETLSSALCLLCSMVRGLSKLVYPFLGFIAYFRTSKAWSIRKFRSSRVASHSPTINYLD